MKENDIRLEQEKKKENYKEKSGMKTRGKRIRAKSVDCERD